MVKSEAAESGCHVNVEEKWRVQLSQNSDFIWPFLRPYIGVIPNPKMVFIFPISCILALIFQL